MHPRRLTNFLRTTAVFAEFKRELPRDCFHAGRSSREISHLLGISNKNTVLAIVKRDRAHAARAA